MNTTKILAVAIAAFAIASGAAQASESIGLVDVHMNNMALAQTITVPSSQADAVSPNTLAQANLVLNHGNG